MNEKAEGKKQEGAQSIHRAIAIIRVVARQNSVGVNLSRIAREVDLPNSTVHRILTVLVEEGMVGYNSQTKRYNLGIGLHLLGLEARQYEIREIYRSTLEKVAQQTEDTAFLVIRSGYDVLCIDRVVGSTPIKVLNFAVGSRRPLGVGAGSLAILASLPDQDAEQIIRHNERRYDSFPGFAPDDIRRMIQFYRQRGYAVNTVTPHIISVGVSLFDNAGTLLGAVSVSSIVSKMDERRQKETAHLIQSEINWRR